LIGEFRGFTTVFLEGWVLEKVASGDGNGRFILLGELYGGYCYLDACNDLDIRIASQEIWPLDSMGLVRPGVGCFR